MKKEFRLIEAKVDALSLRERRILFATGIMLCFLLVYLISIEGNFSRHTELNKKLGVDRLQIATLQAEVGLRMKAHAEDPDITNRKKLAALQKESAGIKAELLGMQKGLVSPDKMASLLEDILRRNGRLRLVSLKTIPVTPLLESDAADAKAVLAKPSAPAVAGTVAPVKATLSVVYKHAVEMTVQGNYLDMVNYLGQLETMPWQLFWGQAKLDARDHTKSTLTLTLFTLSLDQTWLNI